MGAPKQFASKPSLAHSYFQMSLELYGTKAEGLRRLNAALGTSYSFGHVSRWERGDREPERAARLVMLCDVLPWKLQQSGLLRCELDRETTKTITKMAEVLA